MPAYGGGIKKHVRALKGRQPRPLWIPLIPADECTQPANFGIERAKTEIAGREIKLLVVKRVIGNVHLAVESAQRAIGIERCRCIVVESCGALFEQ